MCRRLYVSVGPLAASLILSIALSMALPATAQAQRSLRSPSGLATPRWTWRRPPGPRGDVANDWNQLLYGAPLASISLSSPRHGSAWRSGGIECIGTKCGCPLAPK